MKSHVPFPARAGMNRGNDEERYMACAVPRTRGDEPIADNVTENNALRSPHARG